MRVLILFLLMTISFNGFANRLPSTELKGAKYALVVEADNKVTFQDKVYGDVFIGYVSSVIKGKVNKNAIFFVAPNWYRSWVKASGERAKTTQYMLVGNEVVDYKGTLLFTDKGFSLEELKEAPIEFYEQSYIQTLEKLIRDRELHSKNDVRASIQAVYNEAGMRGEVSVSSKSHQEILAEDALNVLPSFNNALKDITITLKVVVKKESVKAKSVRTAKEIIESWK